MDLLQTTLKTHSRWSNEEVKSLKKMYTEGRSLDDIAQILGRSKTTIYGQLTRLRITGLKRRYKLSARHRKFIDKNYQSMTYKEISMILNVKQISVSGYVRHQIYKGLLEPKYNKRIKNSLTYK